MKRPESCSACFESEEQLKDNILSNRPQWRSDNREIYFAPCGNHHLFGMFNEGRAPKVVIMGITTSPDAKDNYQWTFKQCIEQGSSFNEAIGISCVANCFNSKRPTLQRNLSKILELAQILTLVDVESKVEIEEDLFIDYVNGKCSADKRKVVENVYFSQAILCSSCKRGGGASAPTTMDIDQYHKKCLNAQREIIESFNAKTDLWISFGINDYRMLSSHGCFEYAELPDRTWAKKYIRISHPAGAWGWNELSTFEQVLRHNLDIEIDEFVPKVMENYRGRSSGYRKQVRNCAEQLMNLRDAVKRLISS